MVARRFLRGTLFCALVVVLALGALGCGFKANVVVQLTKPTTHDLYQVDQMTVYLELEGGPTVSAVTGSSGQAAFTVTEPGTYRVVRVDGKNVAGGAIGDQGREYVKGSPLTTAEPLIRYDFTGELPNMTVIDAKQTYTINADIPQVRRVTIIESQVLDIPETPSFYLHHTGSFAGRVILLNINFERPGVVGLHPSNTANNIVVYPQPAMFTGRMYSSGGNVPLFSLYTPSAPYTLVLEAPGNGDWALDATGTIVTRESIGGADASRNFDSFADVTYLDISNGGGGASTPPKRFKMNVETQVFGIF